MAKRAEDYQDPHDLEDQVEHREPLSPRMEQLFNDWKASWQEAALEKTDLNDDPNDRRHTREMKALLDLKGDWPDPEDLAALIMLKTAQKQTEELNFQSRDERREFAALAAAEFLGMVTGSAIPHRNPEEFPGGNNQEARFASDFEGMTKVIAGVMDHHDAKGEFDLNLDTERGTADAVKFTAVAEAVIALNHYDHPTYADRQAGMKALIGQVEADQETNLAEFHTAQQEFRMAQFVLTFQDATDPARIPQAEWQQLKETFNDQEFAGRESYRQAAADLVKDLLGENYGQGTDPALNPTPHYLQRSLNDWLTADGENAEQRLENLMAAFKLTQLAQYHWNQNEGVGDRYSSLQYINEVDQTAGAHAVLLHTALRFQDTLKAAGLDPAGDITLVKDNNSQEYLPTLHFNGNGAGIADRELAREAVQQGYKAFMDTLLLPAAENTRAMEDAKAEDFVQQDQYQLRMNQFLSNRMQQRAVAAAA